ncbi:protein FAM186A isoform X1 [Arvicanthis niloticus]
MSNVQLIMTRYNIDSMSPGRRGSVSETQKKRRKAFIDKIAICSKNIDIRERTLTKLLSWLEEWNFVLSEVAAINMDEYHHWIAKMELMPEMLKGIKNNVDSMIQMTLFLIEEKKRQKKKILARGTLWKAWKDRAIKRPATAQALRPDQMICDQIGLNAKVSEIQNMLQELISTAMFSKLENSAIKYISSTLVNLSKALSTVNDELRLVSYRVAKSFVREDEMAEKEKDHSQQVIQELSEENEVLQQKLRESEEKCDQLIRIKNYLGRQIHPAASLRTVVRLPLQVPYFSTEARDTDSDEKVDSKKEAKSTAVTWDSPASELDLDVAKQQAEDKAEATQDQRKLKVLPLTTETLDTNLEMEEKKPSHLAFLKAPEKKKTGKQKGQEVKSAASSMWEQLRKGKSEQLFRSSPGSPESRESTLKLTDKEDESAPELQKPEMKWKKLIAAKTEVFGPARQSGKSQPKISKETSVTADETEQGNLESFQRAILAFLREKTNNVGKAFDPKSIRKEESSLGKAEVEKFNVIKAKMEEYFQKVAETVTKALRTYRDERKVQPKEKPKKQPKGALGMLRTLPKQGTVGPKSEVGRVLLSEITDPVIKKLVQMLLEEIDSDFKYRRTKELQQEEAEAQKGEPRPKPRDKTELLEAWKKAFKVPEDSQVQDLRDAEDADERPKWSESSHQDLWKVISQASISLAPKSAKTPKPQISQVQTLQTEPGVKGTMEEKQPKQFPSSSKTLLVTAKLTQMHFPEQAQMSPQPSVATLSPERTLSSPLTSEQALKTAFTAAGRELGLGTKLIVPRITELTRTPKASLTSEKPQAMQISQVTIEQISGVTDTQRKDLPFQQVQIKDIIRTSQKALEQETTPTPTPEQETTPTPEQDKKLRITLTPQQTQTLGITLTPEQTKTQRISLTHEQAQALGLTLTPEQYKEQRISLTPQQAQVLGITLNLQQAKALGIILTPEQAKAQRVSLLPQQSPIGTTLTTQQAQAQRINLTPEQAEALGLSMTPQPVTLTPEQTQILGTAPTPTPQPITFTPEQAQALGITATPQPITLTPEQAQALALTLTDQQVKTQKISLSPEQTEALGITPTPQPITFTPEQTQALGITATPQPITLTPEQAQALALTLTTEQVSLSPQQAEALGITPTSQTTLTPEQTEALGITPTPQPITLAPEQVQALGITPTPRPVTLSPEQAQALGITQPVTLSPEQAQALGITPTPQPITLAPEQIQALGITPTPQPVTLSPEQAQALGITPTPRPVTLSPEQSQALGVSLITKEQEISFSPLQAQLLGLTLTPQQAQVQKIYVTPQQAQALGITLSPEQAKTLKISLTPEQAHSLGIILTVEQARAQRISLTPQQAEGLGITLSPEQAQALGVSLTPKEQEISFSPRQAQFLGLTLTPEQTQVQKIYFTPQQAQALGVTLSPEQAKAMKISLTPEQAHSLGITLTVEQARAQKINLTPQQAQDLGITLSPEQAQALGVSLIPKEQEISFSPRQAQALGLTLTPEQAQVQKIYVTPQQAQALGVTLSPEQAKAMKVSLTPEQAHSLGITLTVEQARAQRINLTPQQAQDLGITLTPEQVQDLGVSLIPKEQEISFSPLQAQLLGLTLTPQQAQVQKIYFTLEQAQALGITLSPEQAKTLTISLTPEQAHSLGITLTVEQARAQRINLTPQQAQDLGITLTPEQAQDLGIAPTHKQAEALGIIPILRPEPDKERSLSLTPEQVLSIIFPDKDTQSLGIYLTLKQAQNLGISLTASQAKVMKISLTPEQAQALGITFTLKQAKARRASLTPKQAEALGITLTPEQAKAHRITLTLEQAQALGITLTPEQAQALGITLTPEEAHAQGILSPKKFQELDVPLTYKQAETLRSRLSMKQLEALTSQRLVSESIQMPKPAVASKQTQTIDIPLTTKLSQAFGVPLPKKQSSAEGISPLTSQQIQAFGVPLPKKQSSAEGISPLTPKQTQAFGVPLPKKQGSAEGISPLTPKQPQAFGVLLSKKQGSAEGISPLISQQIQAFGVPLSKRKKTELGTFPLTPKQTQAVRASLSKRKKTELGTFPLTPKQTQAVEPDKAMQPPLTPRQALPLQDQLAPELIQTLVFTITLKKAQNLGINFTYEQTRAAAVTLTSEQVAALEDALTEELAWRWELVTAEQLREAPDIAITKQRQALETAAQSAQALHIPFSLEKPATLVPSTDRLSQRLKDSYPASIPLQALRSSLTQAPFPPPTSLGMSILPDSEKPWMSPTYRQTLTDRGQGIPAQPVGPEIPSSLRQLLAPGAPPTPGPPLGPKHFFKPRDTWPLLISEPPFRPRTPPASRVLPTSGEVPRLVSGGSAAHKELLTSRTSPFQPPAVREQVPFSTLEWQGPSWTVPEQGLASTISPIPLHPSTAEALPPPGRPQRSSEAKPLKPKSARALGFEAVRAPFPIEKTQIPKISDTSEQTQVLQDSFGMQPCGIFQPYVTSSRIPRSQSPLIVEKALSREKPGLPLPALTTQLPQTPQISTSEKGEKPWLPPIDKPWTPTPVSVSREAKMLVPPFTDEHSEDRYVVDVEAQRRNLVTLNQAAQTSRLPAQYLTTAKNLIIELLHLDTVRLGYLSRKYVAYRLIQLARNQLSKRLKTIQNTGKGYESQSLYIMLDRIDQHQKKVMHGWTDKQKHLDQRRKQCLRSMTQLFSQLARAFKVNLSQPMPSIPSFKKIPEFTKLQRPVLELLIDDSKRSDLFKTLRQAPVEAVWNADQSTSSYPIIEKAPMSVLWAQLGGYPDIPKMLQLEIQSTFRKSLASIQSQSKKIRKWPQN